MSKNPNDNENTVPWEQIDPEHMRSEAEKHGNSGYNKQIDAEEMRSEAEKHGSASHSQHRKHEREIAAIERKAGR